MKLFDTHAHLDSFIKDASLANVLNNARAAGLEGIIAASNSPADWTDYERVSAENEGFVNWGIGIHPEEIDQDSDLALDALTSYFASHAPIMVGEIGLDFFRLPKDKTKARDIVERQLQIYRRQLRLAVDMNVPVCIHARCAVDEAIDELKSLDFPAERAIFHCFAGSPSQLKRLNDMGGRASFTGIITYPNADEMRQCLREQPLDKTMFETDCPFLAPVPLRGKKNTPENVAFTVKAAAQILGIDADELAQISTQNAKAFFGL